MIKIFGIIGIVILLASCDDDPILLRNGLTMGADKITDTLIKIKVDSEGIEFYDTLSITERLYNNEDNIILRKQETPFDKSQMKIEYKYNDLGSSR